jgi:curved DNA-binding protein CbpA
MFRWIKNLFSKQDYKDESLNVVASIGKAKSLYKDLIVKAHPDKHPNQSELATTLTELINKNRYNYSELLKIKNRIETELQ